uniref:SPBc2 prophage-derived uncharacterized protein yotK n=1 Tax=Anthurium amnicola TaxID=1678845 RepID=A0A1D1Y2Y3_9ARAE
MRREGASDPAAVHSSIALLQERFRQLQRVREMREERELLRACSESGHTSPGARSCSQQPQWFLHPHLVHPSRPLNALKGLRPEAGTAEHTEFPDCSTSLSMGSWAGRSSIHSSYGSDEKDVDTSLHL